MSTGKNRHEAQRWLETEEEDHAAAKTLLQQGHFPHAVFTGSKPQNSLTILKLHFDPHVYNVNRGRLGGEAVRTGRIPAIA